MQKSKLQFKSQKFAQLLFERSREFSLHWQFSLRVTTIFLFLVAILFNSQTVFAHTLKVDGAVGVTVHIDPDDAPVAGKESTIFVNIKDSTKKFDEKNPGTCECILTITKDEEVLKTLPIANGNTYNSLQFIFTESGSYDLIVTGKPNGKGSAFEPFETEYNYYVSSGESNILFKENPLQKYTPFVIVIVGFVILFMFLNPFKKS